MFQLLARRFQRRFRAAGLLIAAVAMASQLALGATAFPLPPSGPMAALATLSVLCHGQQPLPDRPVPSRGIPFVAVCPLGATPSLPAAILSLVRALPEPPPVLALRVVPPRAARAPPAHAALTAYPRGPPVST